VPVCEEGCLSQFGDQKINLVAIEGLIRRRLLQLARAAFDASVRKEKSPVVPRDIAVKAFGVFVTVHHRRDLRGCLGSLDCADTVIESLLRLAASVAHEDYRFRPIAIHELAYTLLDVSMLTPPQRVNDHSMIEVGRHGLIIEQGTHRGLLLPQVAPEHGWDRETFLAHTCIKAGLPRTAWMRGASLFCFEAEVFGEHEPE
jgi:AmmeMemoRadiSam system protein A